MKKWKVRIMLLAVVLAMAATGVAIAADIDMTMFYPIAVGGKPYEIINGLIQDFESQNTGIKVKAVYYGNYDDTRTKCLAALKAGERVQLSVLFSIDIFDLLDEDIILPWEDVVKTDEDVVGEGMGCFSKVIEQVAIYCDRNDVAGDPNEIAIRLWTFVHGASSLLIDGDYAVVVPDLDVDALLEATTPRLLGHD